MARRVPSEMSAAYGLRALGVSVSLQEYCDELPAMVRDDLLLFIECEARRAEIAAERRNSRG